MDGHCFWGWWALAHWLVRSCSHSPWVYPLRVRFMDDSILQNGRGACSDSSGVLSSHFQTSRCQRCLEKASRLPAVVDSLAALAFNEASLKTASGGRLSSSAGV